MKRLLFATAATTAGLGVWRCPYLGQLLFGAKLWFAAFDPRVSSTTEPDPIG